MKKHLKHPNLTHFAKCKGGTFFRGILLNLTIMGSYSRFSGIYQKYPKFPSKWRAASTIGHISIMHVFRSAGCVFSKRNSMCVRLHFDAAWQLLRVHHGWDWGSVCSRVGSVLIGSVCPKTPSGSWWHRLVDGQVLRTWWEVRQIGKTWSLCNLLDRMAQL